MKIPKNWQIINFLETYGLTLVMAIAVLLVAKSIITWGVKTVYNTVIPSCSLGQLEQGDTVNFKGTTFKVESLDYNEYDWSGDNVRINLEESKN